MNVLVDFNTIEEARISAAARQIGLAPADYVKKIVSEHLPPTTTEDGDDPMLALFAQWDAEDGHMTPDEVDSENRSWEELKDSINAERKRASARKVF